MSIYDDINNAIAKLDEADIPLQDRIIYAHPFMRSVIEQEYKICTPIFKNDEKIVYKTQSGYKITFIFKLD